MVDELNFIQFQWHLHTCTCTFSIQYSEPNNSQPRKRYPNWVICIFRKNKKNKRLSFLQKQALLLYIVVSNRVLRTTDPCPDQIFVEWNTNLDVWKELRWSWKRDGWTTTERHCDTFYCLHILQWLEFNKTDFAKKSFELPSKAYSKCLLIFKESRDSLKTTNKNVSIIILFKYTQLLRVVQLFFESDPAKNTIILKTILKLDEFPAY